MLPLVCNPVILSMFGNAVYVEKFLEVFGIAEQLYTCDEMIVKPFGHLKNVDIVVNAIWKQD